MLKLEGLFKVKGFGFTKTGRMWISGAIKKIETRNQAPFWIRYYLLFDTSNLGDNTIYYKDMYAATFSYVRLNTMNLINLTSREYVDKNGVVNKEYTLMFDQSYIEFAQAPQNSYNNTNQSNTNETNVSNQQYQKLYQAYDNTVFTQAYHQTQDTSNQVEEIDWDD